MEISFEGCGQVHVNVQDLGRGVSKNKESIGPEEQDVSHEDEVSNDYLPEVICLDQDITQQGLLVMTEEQLDQFKVLYQY